MPITRKDKTSACISLQRRNCGTEAKELSDVRYIARMYVQQIALVLEIREPPSTTRQLSPRLR